jgi:hypothetical protein
MLVPPLYPYLPPSNIRGLTNSEVNLDNPVLSCINPGTETYLPSVAALIAASPASVAAPPNAIAPAVPNGFITAPVSATAGKPTLTSPFIGLVLLSKLADQRSLVPLKISFIGFPSIQLLKIFLIGLAQ